MSNKAFDWLDAPVKIVAGLNTPIPYNSTLEQASIPHKADIVKAVKEVCYKFNRSIKSKGDKNASL